MLPLHLSKSNLAASMFSSTMPECSDLESSDDVRAIYEVNVYGALRMNRAVLPIMHRQNQGLLMHVTSSAGRLVFPFMGIYGSSKFALEAIAEGYHYELSQTGIESIIVQPGSFATKVASNMLSPSDLSRADAYAAIQPQHQGIKAALVGGESDPNAPNPQAVADVILTLVNAKPKTRPLRTIVDVHFAAMVESINRACSEAEPQALGAMGMTNLVPNIPSSAT
jgi:NADP-dependent 3-hydroxy acid dehydrogenase YdfG